MTAQSEATSEVAIQEQEVSAGSVHGTTYESSTSSRTHAVLLMHGLSGNRHGLQTVARRLASEGYYCLSIDLPGHHKNTDDFSLGRCSETANEAIRYLRSLGAKHIAVVGHSTGAITALYASAGYTQAIEQSIYSLWETIRTATMQLTRNTYQNNEFKAAIERSVEEAYKRIKQLILASVKEGVTTHTGVDCYVMLAPPRNVKQAIPAVSLLRHLPRSVQKKLVSISLDQPAVRQIHKEGNPVDFPDKRDESKAHWQFLSTDDIREFFVYFSSMKEPVDYLQLVEGLANMHHIPGKVNFFEYYQKKFISLKPKLFVYGTRDLYLRVGIPGVRARLEQFYHSCGNAIVHSGNFTHVMTQNPKQQFAASAVTNGEVLAWTTAFIKQHIPLKSLATFLGEHAKS